MTSQLALSLDSKESPEVIDLVSRAKTGDEEAGNKLHAMYKDAICGETIIRKLNYRIFKGTSDGEEAISILNEIFVNAINSYDPKRAKFITHLINLIKYQFHQLLRKERLIPIRQNLSSKKMEEFMDKTSFVFDNFIDDTRVNLDRMVSFSISGQEFSVPENVFISKFVVDRVKEIVPISRRRIYAFYLKCILAGDKNPEKKTNDKYKLKGKQLVFILRKCNAIINKSLQIKGIHYER